MSLFPVGGGRARTRQVPGFRRQDLTTGRSQMGREGVLVRILQRNRTNWIDRYTDR